MNEKNRRLVENWIATKVPKYACVFCGGKTPMVGEVVMPPLANDPARGSPVVIVICRSCARVDLFDAVSVGLRPPFE